MRKTILTLLLTLLCFSASAQAFSEEEARIEYTDPQGRPVVLTGTLTLPAARAPRHGFPAMVLVSGSGQQNRDEELLGHKPFKVIAEYMAERGIAVLRYDDRGMGGSTGEVLTATTLDFANDAEAAYRWLSAHKRIDRKRTGILGHSEGALIAPIVASRDKGVGFIVLLAGQGCDGAQVLLQQNRAYFTAMGVEDSLVSRRMAMMEEAFAAADSAMGTLATADSAARTKALNTLLREIVRRHAEGLDKEQKQQVGLVGTTAFGLAVQLQMPWMRTFLKLSPEPYYANLRCRVLALNGSKDCQVTAHPNLDLIRQMCRAAGTEADTVCLEGMNHLFQHCDKGTVEEYAALGQAPAPEVLERIADWVLK